MNRSQRAVSTLLEVDPDFQTMAEVLYGPGVDAQAIWEDVFAKREPERTSDTQRRVAAASNALGLTAGTAAIGATLRDERLKGGGRVARGLYRTGQKIPKPIERATRKIGTKGAGRLALGAAGLQLANVAGDVVVSRTLPKGDKVSKIAVMDLTQGTLKGLKGLMPTGEQIGRGAAQLREKPVHTLFKTPVGAAATGSTATFAATRPGKRRAENRGFNAGYNSAYAKRAAPDVVWEGTFSKLDEDKRLAFGWASVVEKDGVPVVDRQGDYISPDDMENAAYVYVQKSRKGGDMHRRVTNEFGEEGPHHVSDLVESMVFTKEKIAKMGLPPTTPVGWWVGFKIHDDDTWAEVKKGGRTGFSIHGKGRREDTSVDKIMGT